MGGTCEQRSRDGSVAQAIHRPVLAVFVGLEPCQAQHCGELPRQFLQRAGSVGHLRHEHVIIGLATAHLDPRLAYPAIVLHGLRRARHVAVVHPGCRVAQLDQQQVAALHVIHMPMLDHGDVARAREGVAHEHDQLVAFARYGRPAIDHARLGPELVYLALVGFRRLPQLGVLVAVEITARCVFGAHAWHDGQELDVMLLGRFLEQLAHQREIV